MKQERKVLYTNTKATGKNNQQEMLWAKGWGLRGQAQNNGKAFP